MWIVSIHDGGGSMVEAAEPVFDALFRDEATATNAENAINAALQSMGGHYAQEWWCMAHEVHNFQDYDVPLVGTATLKPGEMVFDMFDMKELVELLANGDAIELKPPAPTEAEEQAAIQSILGGIYVHEARRPRR